MIVTRHVPAFSYFSVYGICMYIFRKRFTFISQAMADDDSWLYGDDNEEEETPAEDAPLMPISKPEQEEVEAPPAVEPVEEEKDVEEEKAEEDNDSSDESDDDGINFTIDHVKINDAKESYKNMQVGW